MTEICYSEKVLLERSLGSSRPRTGDEQEAQQGGSNYHPVKSNRMRTMHRSKRNSAFIII